jgi:hypothetical protein
MIAVTRREIERWPGVAVTFANGGKHITATLAYGDKTRMVVCAKTPSDNGRGVKNHVAEVRRALLSLGAARIATAKSTAPKRQRNKPVRRPPVPAERAPVPTNGFEKLAALMVPEPRVSRLNRILAAIGRVFRG